MNLFSSSQEWLKIAENIKEIIWQDNHLTIIEIKGKKITLAKYDDTLFAVAYKCPHAGAIMAEGYIDAIGNIVCPLHRYKFSLQKGRNVTGEGYYLKTYPVESRADGIYVYI